MTTLSPEICRRVAGLGQLSMLLGEARARQIGLAVAGSLADVMKRGGDPGEALNIWTIRVALEVASQHRPHAPGNIRRLREVLPEVGT